MEIERVNKEIRMKYLCIKNMLEIKLKYLTVELFNRLGYIQEEKIEKKVTIFLTLT